MCRIRMFVVMLILLSAPFALAAPTLTVGINPNIHNTTGVPAYDFHLQGVIMSESQPVQKDQFVFPVSQSIPAGFDWSYDGGSITQDPVDPAMWHYSGSWSGTVPVLPCEIIHVGKYFEVECHNAFLDLRGWWTDQNGNPINPNAGQPGGTPGTFVSDVPLLGFDVRDQSSPQTLFLTNSTTESIRLVDYQVAVSATELPLSSLMEGSPELMSLSWTMLEDLVVIAPAMTLGFNLNAAGVVIPSGQFLVMQGFVEDWGNPGEYLFFAEIHEAHIIPEPMAVGIMGLAALALRRRR